MVNSNQDELLEDWPRRRDTDVNRLFGVGATEKEEEDKTARRDQETLLLEDWPETESNSCSTLASTDSGEAEAASTSAVVSTTKFCTVHVSDGLASKACTTTVSVSGEEKDNRASTFAVASISATKHARTVHFADTSQLYVHKRESMSLLQMSYTDMDRRRFSREAMQDGLRIKTLIDQAPRTSVAESMTYLLRHGIIARYEVVGIEHYCLGKPSSVAIIRRHHAAAVLRKQQELKEQQQQTKKDEDVALRLSKFAQSNSLRSTQHAMMRAGMASWSR